MNDPGKSDRPSVPTKQPNKAGNPGAEVVEGRGLAKGNTDEQNASRTQSRNHDVLNALDALAVGIRRKKVNWVLDADIRGFFDSIDHGWLMRFLEHRIADRTILRLIQKWLSAGAMAGTPQGATVSPVLANVFLHEVLDRWFSRTWRRRCAAKRTLFAMRTMRAWYSSVRRTRSE
jgi:retron-type reverse transcriptase